MIEDTETKVEIKKSKLFALQLDESKDIQNNIIGPHKIRYFNSYCRFLVVEQNKF
jgi:hypothetical protein